MSLGILEGEVIAEISGDLFAQWQRTGRHHTLAAVTIEVAMGDQYSPDINQKIGPSRNTQSLGAHLGFW